VIGWLHAVQRMPTWSVRPRGISIADCRSQKLRQQGRETSAKTAESKLAGNAQSSEVRTSKISNQPSALDIQFQLGHTEDHSMETCISQLSMWFIFGACCGFIFGCSW
jgi:hypothetical protein